jgi:hypothetical protein
MSIGAASGWRVVIKTVDDGGERVGLVVAKWLTVCVRVVVAVARVVMRVCGGGCRGKTGRAGQEMKNGKGPEFFIEICPLESLLI